MNLKMHSNFNMMMMIQTREAFRLLKFAAELNEYEIHLQSHLLFDSTLFMF